MLLAPGTLLAGRFEVDGPPLGAGASGVVYPTVDRATGREVAAKVLHPHLVGDPASLARLQDEAGTAGRLRHPHVLEVLGLHSDGGGRWVLVTERVDGVALSSLEAPLEPRAAILLVTQLVDALAAAHAVGIVHGDVRPGNVLLGRRGALLFDFGVASFAAGSEAPDDPLGRVAVRPGESAPEVLAGALPGIPADLYGLGAVLHHALVARPAFVGDTPWALLGAQRRRPPGLVGPRGLVALIQALMDPDPANRPASAAVVRRALRKLARNPDRPVSLRRFWVPPVRVGRAWLVHGVDPRTGGRALVKTGLSRRASFALVGRLRAQGWDVRADREALGGWDILLVLAVGAVGALLLPVLGLLPALVLAMRWRGRRVRPELRRALPALVAPLPARVVQSGGDAAILAGFLMLLTAVALWLQPWLALPPALGVLCLALFSWRARAPDHARAAREGRIAAALASVRAAIETRALSLEASLGLTGEVDALEARWMAGEIDGDDMLVGLDDLAARAARGSGPAPVGAATLEALRRSLEP